MFASGIENGAGTGWTLYDRELLFGNLEAIKLFSMREHLQILLIYVMCYSCLILFFIGSIITTYVKMHIARRKYAWVEKCFSTHQRLHKEYLNNKNNNNNNNNNNNKRNKKNIMTRIFTGIKVGWNAPMLPPKVLSFHNHYFTRIFRVIGGISVITFLSKKYLLFIYPFNYVVLLFALLHFMYIATISIIKLFYGIKVLKSDKLEVRNSPIDKLAKKIKEYSDNSNKWKRWKTLMIKLDLNSD